jgi:digalactosyldiacylglycerol synthase
MHFPFLLLMLMVESWANSTHTQSKAWQQELWPSKRAKKRIQIRRPNDIIPESDLRDINRRIWIITTASLPWLTGTSVNPLLRAAYLAKDRPPGRVTLMVPWLKKEEQDIAFPPKLRFDHPNDQMKFVKNWLIEEAHMPISAEKLEISFYAARLINSDITMIIEILHPCFCFV